MDQTGFNRKVFFSILIVGSVAVLWWATPKAQKSNFAFELEEGTFELLVENNGRDVLPVGGFVRVDEYCADPDYSGPTVSTSHPVVEGHVWRIRLLCPDNGTQWVGFNFFFDGYHCTPSYSALRYNPDGTIVSRQVACSPETAENAP